MKKDRIGKYLEKYGDEFVFDEFSPKYLEKERLSDIMKGVPVPLRTRDVVDFHGPKGLPLAHLAENMARVMGINPDFQYAPSYMRYIRKYFNDKIVDALVKEGRDEAEEGQLDHAAIHFRAALLFSPEDLHAMYSYARACRELYLAEEGGDPNYIGAFKAESMEYFERCTQVHPAFAQAWYFLGYAYLNMGLYLKAALVWKEFLKRSRNGKDKKEIRERLEQLEDPVKIETGCNHMLAGRFEQGLSTLEPYVETRYESWWPLHYYLGVGYSRTGEAERAIRHFKRALSLSPSHGESMEELSALYEALGDSVLAEKYRKKRELV